MKNIQAGVILRAKFVLQSNQKYRNYISYIDREAAVRNKHYNDYNGFANTSFGDYHEYMKNPEKTTGLFTADHDTLTSEQIKSLKETFNRAEKNGSPMWQCVISFDMSWLEMTGCYQSDIKKIDEARLKSATRLSVSKLLEKEEMFNSAVWSASIHYNTKHVHIHLAIVEPVPTRKEMINLKTGKKEARGKLKLSSIEAAKSVVVNELSQSRENTIKLNDLIRNKILKNQMDRNIMQDEYVCAKLLALYQQLPESRRDWKYNMNKMKPLRPQLDQITELFLNTYYKEEFEEIKQLAAQQETAYIQAYGHRKNGDENHFYQNKLNDLYTRMGNATLRHLQDYDREVLGERFRRRNRSHSSTGKTGSASQRASPPYSNSSTAKAHPHSSSTLMPQENKKSYRNNVSFGRGALAKLKYEWGKTFKEHYQNMQTFQELEQNYEMDITERGI